MQLNQVAHFNDLSDKLRKELEDKIKGFGKSVRYKFNISNPNPDPTKYNGAIIWPNVYTLDPTVFNITDPYEDRPKTSKSKRIAFVDGVDEKGLPNKFRKVRVEGKYLGILKLDLENDEQFNLAMLIELHPKLSGGMFSDKSKYQVITRIDEKAMATEQRTIRTAKKKAQDVAEQMSDKQVVDFCDAMQWDSSEDIDILRNKVEAEAEINYDLFNDLVAGKKIEYQATVKQALDRGIILYNPADMKITWASNHQTIAMLNDVAGLTAVEQAAEWFQVGGDKAKEAFNKIKSLVGGKKEVVV